MKLSLSENLSRSTAAYFVDSILDAFGVQLGSVRLARAGPDWMTLKWLGSTRLASLTKCVVTGYAMAEAEIGLPSRRNFLHGNTIRTGGTREGQERLL